MKWLRKYIVLAYSVWLDKYFIVCLPFVEQSGGQKNVAPYLAVTSKMSEATIGRPVSMLNSARIEMSDLCCLTQIGFASLYPFFVNCLFLAAIHLRQCFRHKPYMFQRCWDLHLKPLPPQPLHY